MRLSFAVAVGVLAVLATAGPAHAFVGTDTFTYTFGDFDYTVTIEARSATRAVVTVEVKDASGLRARFTGTAREIRTAPFLPNFIVGDYNNDGVVDGSDVTLPRRLARPFLVRSNAALAAKFANRARGIIGILIS